MAITPLLLASLSSLVHPACRQAAPLRPRCGRLSMEEKGGMLASVGTMFEEAFGGMPAGEKYNAVMLSLLSRGGEAGPAAIGPGVASAACFG